MSIKDKKILFVIPTLTGGGAERVVSILSTALSEKGYDISLLLNERCQNEYPIGSKVKVFAIPREIHEKKGNFAKISRIRSRYLLTKKIAPDITITFLNDAIQFLCNITLKGKFVSTIRVNPGSGSLFARILRCLIIAASDACIVQNEEQKMYFAPYLQRKIYILPNPIIEKSFVEKIDIREHVRKIVTVGRLTEQKNHKLLIDAFSTACEQMMNISLDIYGEGPERNELEQYIDKHNLKEKVFLRGRTNNVQKVLNESDLFVLSSNYEGLPNALLEAMAMGLPVISTDCPTGPSDIIEKNINGILVPINDRKAMAEAIILMESYDVRLKYALNGYKHVKENYSLDKVLDKLCEILKSIST